VNVTQGILCQTVILDRNSVVDVLSALCISRPGHHAAAAGPCQPLAYTRPHILLSALPAGVPCNGKARQHTSGKWQVQCAAHTSCMLMSMLTVSFLRVKMNDGMSSLCRSMQCAQDGITCLLFTCCISALCMLSTLVLPAAAHTHTNLPTYVWHFPPPVVTIFHSPACS
jgi:hypothetical protein